MCRICVFLVSFMNLKEIFSWWHQTKKGLWPNCFVPVNSLKQIFIALYQQASSITLLRFDYGFVKWIWQSLCVSNCSVWLQMGPSLESLSAPTCSHCCPGTLMKLRHPSFKLLKAPAVVLMAAQSASYCFPLPSLASVNSLKFHLSQLTHCYCNSTVSTSSNIFYLYLFIPIVPLFLFQLIESQHNYIRLFWH